MPRKGFTEEQIAFALRQAESGTPVGEVCRKLGVSEQSFYRWKKQFAGMGISEIRRLKQLEDENTKLKRLVADLTLDKTMLWDALRKMYDLPRPGKARIRSDDGSPPKCIRPLASGLRLRPGHDEIRAHRSQINGSCRSTFFLELTMRRSAISSSRFRARFLFRFRRQATAGSRRS
jgi:putative transposase